MRNRVLRKNLSCKTLVAASVLLAVVAAPGMAQRGATGPEEHAQVKPINDLPNPYQTVRNWGELPDDRK